jgi:hypothetical protein
MRPPVSHFLLALALAGSPPGLAGGAETAEAPVSRPEERSALRLPPAFTFQAWLGEVTGFTSEPRPPFDKEKPYDWHLFPFVVANPLIGVGGGAATVGALRLGDPRSTDYSSFAGSAIVTTNGQVSVGLLTDLRLPANDWLLVGDWGWSHFPNPAWGVGGDTPDSNRTIVDRRELRFSETGFRRLAGHVYAGAGAFLNSFYEIVDRRAALGEQTAFSDYGIGTQGHSFSAGLSANLLLDTRDSPINPMAGTYLLARYRWSPAALGGETDWQSLYLDARAFLPLRGQTDTIAFWAFAWTTSGQTPYLLLPAIGADPERRSGRGYIEARHVGRDLLYGEIEYRFRIWEFLGGVVGANVHSASDRAQPEGGPIFETWSPAVSAGLRAMLDRRSQSSLVFDVAVTARGNVGVYVNANEAF